MRPRLNHTMDFGTHTSPHRRIHATHLLADLHESEEIFSFAIPSSISFGSDVSLDRSLQDDIALDCRGNSFQQDRRKAYLLLH